MAEGKALGFVALRSLTEGPLDPAAAIDAIRRIYFTTTRETVEHDLAHAVELLKSIPDDTVRDRAAVFMDGISQMRSDWARQKSRRTSPPAKSAPGATRARRPAKARAPRTSPAKKSGGGGTR